MRLGKLILQICAVIIAAALIFAAYTFYKQYQVRTFQERLTTLQSPVYAPFADLILSAPNLTCTYQASNFDEAVRTVAYIADGRFSKVSIPLSRPQEALYQVMDETGSYLWREDSETILFIPMEMLRELPATGVNEVQAGFGAIVGGMSCDVWWNTDARVFRVPADRPIIPYDEY